MTILDILYCCNIKCTTLNTQVKASDNTNANNARNVYYKHCTFGCEHFGEFLYTAIFVGLYKRLEGGSQTIFMLLYNEAVQAIFPE